MEKEQISKIFESTYKKIDERIEDQKKILESIHEKTIKDRVKSLFQSEEENCNRKRRAGLVHEAIKETHERELENLLLVREGIEMIENEINKEGA